MVAADTPTRSRDRLRPSNSALVIGAVVLAVTALPIVFPWITSGRIVSDLGQLAAAVIAWLACRRTARSTSGRMRRSWRAISVGCAGWAVGELLWTVLDVGYDGQVPYPSLADVGFLVFPIGAIACLLLFPPAGGKIDRVRSVLDGSALLAALIAIYWATASPFANDGRAPVTGLLAIVTIAYPTGDLLIIGLAFYIVSQPTRHRLALVLLAGGVSVMALADAGFAALESTDYQARLPDIGWAAAFLFLGCAATIGGRLLAVDRATGNSPPPSQPPGASMLPYLPLAIAVATVGFRAITGRGAGVVETAALTVAVSAVLLRQYLTVRDNRQLLGVVASREAQLVRQAFQDQLTGLHNRALFTDRVAHALDLHRRDLRPVGLLFCDLDDFKAVNDTYGHAAGDEVLIRVAERLRGALRDGDTIARFGGDEFAVLLEDGSEPTTVATRIIDALRAPFTVNEIVIHVGISVGVTDLDGQQTIPTLDELLAHADVAMYSAKRSGKGRLALWESTMVLPAAVDLRLREPLRTALRTGGIVAVYQPIINLEDGRMTAVETLARWMHDGLQVSPVEFVPLAGRAGLMTELTDHMLNEACRQMATWTRNLGDHGLRTGVNIPPQLIVDQQFPDRVASILARYDVPPEQLVLEITEDALLGDLATARTVTSRLRELGASLSLDDFGTGYSSLLHLRQIPLDALKIDISFIDDIDRDADAERFLRAFLSLGRDLGLTVTAEGVEREGQVTALRRLGCPTAQGFLFARPGTAAELESGLLAPGAHWTPAATPAARGRRSTPGRVG
ncbi:bifunctional diguanylate cyclase/phosphodiesterase [Nakamurella sp. PAMC28650]|uniref:putative bifunctional diguanylate cyclase/phosphodiesterase n=1 Tax=Nakamurella sp. PAMC28650 TaxID=2762325 RepID=UPI00164DD9B7|nr:EAL domain-containing protein [Nakamurella sp. PAMC28650]QNK82035.1 EAL domain-containing protein [Nakamurella sp. PAMC28650]